MRKIIMVPGTYDPPTKGHEQVWKSLANVGQIVVAIGHNVTKPSGMFSPAARAKMIERLLRQNNIDGYVMLYDGALVDAVKKCEASLVVRGVRGPSDLEEGYVFADHLARCGSVPIAFIPSPAELRGCSSTLVRQLMELPTMDEELKRLLPDSVYRVVRRGALGMRARFEKLWAELGFSGNAKNVFEDLLLRYGEDGREYHTMEHIRWTLQRMDECRAHFSEEEAKHVNRLALEWSIWFHDAVMEYKSDDEERSAELARATALQHGASESFAERVKQLVLATAHKGCAENDLGAALIVDADLSILGADEPAFDRYEALVREEKREVPEDIFRRVRAEILQRFLQRPHIFTTAHARNKWEAQARENLSRSVTRLLSGAAFPTL